ncbi:MAG: hypothetical protein GC180_11135 [Bacteroidetes bacterium]|nr:hypothetical protein [Bacteroidota bacterium]
MKKIHTLLLFLFLGSFVNAQPYLGMHFVGSSALNNFCDSGYKNGYGFGMEFFSKNLLQSTKTKAVDFRFGIGFDIQGAGRHSQSVIFNTSNSAPGKEVYSNSHVGLTGSARLMFFPEKRLNPYIDGNIGLRGFYTQQTLTLDKPDPNYQSSTDNSILHAGTQRYGGSLGLMYRLTHTIYLDTRVTYSAGTTGNWINLDHIKYENGIANYQNTRTTTDLFIYYVGFSFRFHKSNHNGEGTSNPPKKTTSPSAPKKKKVITTTPSPSPTPKKPLEVKPTPPAPKPKPQY